MDARVPARLWFVIVVVAAVAVGSAGGPAATAAPRPPAAVTEVGGRAATVARSDPAAVAALLAAWQRSRTATFVVRSTFERRVTGGQQLRAESLLAQRPPDRLLRQDGTVSGRLGGRRVACTQVDGDALPCADAGSAPAYDDEVAAELGALRRLVAGPSAEYAVTADGTGCFALRLRVWAPAPAYGTAARFCFDRATGAPTRTEVRRPEGTDVTAAVDVGPAPSAAHFDLPG